MAPSINVTKNLDYYHNLNLPNALVLGIQPFTTMVLFVTAVPLMCLVFRAWIAAEEVDLALLRRKRQCSQCRTTQ